jgi:virulence-associated protein VagC
VWEDSLTGLLFRKGRNMISSLFMFPTEVARDTGFPLKDGDRVEVEIKGKTLVIKPVKN